MDKAELRFYVDPETGETHASAHGITEEEVDQVFDGSADVHPGSDDSRVLEGPTHSGRVLRVIYVPDAEGDAVFVVTAYELKGKDLKAYRRRRRKRPR